ncbi:MAG: GNAT family N-acetyltransferase [Patescibacteria group bacterium]
MNATLDIQKSNKPHTLVCGKQQGLFDIAEDDLGIKGFIIMEDLRDGVSHYMVQINVLEKRKGIGKALFNKVVERIGEDGHVSLCVNTDNEEAIKFYEAVGFTRSGHTVGYRKGQDKYWYQMDL